MRILVNDTYEFEVQNENLIVKDKKLFNKATNKFEGVEGDMVEFLVKDNDKTVILSGTVDGYTDSGKVKIRGRDTIYNLTEEAKMKFINLASVVEI